MRKNSEVCLICGKKGFKNSNSFTKHIRVHKIKCEDYYNKYIHETTKTCNICGKKVGFMGIDNGYSNLCQYCNNRDSERIVKIKKTNLERYGVENPSQVKEFKEKRKQTNLERYGVEHTSSNPDIMQRCLDTWKKNYKDGNPARDENIKEKRKQTNLERYGTICPIQNDKIQKEIKKNNLEKYGVECAMSSKEIQKKLKDGMFKKYGVEHALCKDEFLEKARQTNLVNNGVEWPMQNPNILEKSKQSNLKNNGVEWPQQNEEVLQKSIETCKNKYGVSRPIQNKEIKKKCEDTLEVRYGERHPFKVDHIVEKISGKNHYNWNPNREEVFSPYTEKFCCDEEFRKQIWIEQNGTDPVTGFDLENGAHLHHIDYDKQNDDRSNLIFLNPSQHAKTNTNRIEWQNLLSEINNEIINFNKK